VSATVTRAACSSGFIWARPGLVPGHRRARR
jgi:hypothetical protein